MTGRAPLEGRARSVSGGSVHATGEGIHPVMALSDFMPYGAPELLEGASPRMARSTFAATAMVAVLVWGLGIVAASRHPVLEPTIEVPPDVFNPEQLHVLPPPSTAPPVARIARVDGDFRVIPVEALVPPTIVEPPSIAPVSPVRGTGSDVERTQTIGPAPPEREPLPDEYVYTDELPQLVRGVKPLYPDIAREAGVEGTVKLQLLIGLDGRVLRVIVQRNGSVPMLDEAAIAAAMASVFTPALANNRPVKVWVTQNYHFKLH